MIASLGLMLSAAATFSTPSVPPVGPESVVALDVDPRSREEKLARLRWASDRRSVCGSHALYAWLRVLGEGVEYAVVEQTLGLSPVGHDMLSVQRAAEGFGVAASVRRYETIEQLRASDYPLIALGNRSAIRQGVRTRHYLVAIENRGGVVRYVDPTTGEIRRSREEDFLDGTTGYYVARERGWAASRTAVIAGILGFLGATLLLRLRRAPFPMRVAAAVGAAAVLLAAPGFAQTWRTPENDGRNSLTMLLRAHGEPIEHADVCAALNGPGSSTSLLDLREAGSALGVDLAIVKTEPFEAMAPYLPAVVHLRHPRRHEGGFSVVCGLTPDGVSLIEGGTCRFVRIGWEDFLGEWSGHLLVHPAVAAAEGGAAEGGLRLPVFLSAGVALCYLALRWR